LDDIGDFGRTEN